LAENTIVMFLSDHGDYAGDYGLQRKGAGLPECLIHVPFLIAGPGVEASRNNEDFISLVDIMPTICEAIGAEIPFGCQGRSIWPIVTGGDYPEAEFSSIYSEIGFGSLPYGVNERPPLHFDYAGPTFDELNTVTMSGNLKMVRKGDWKLIFDVMGKGELYNLATDPGELENLYADARYAGERLAMMEELLYWTIRSEDPLPRAKYLPKTAPHNWYRQ
jgi:arylsulfatase A-like enzyme